MKSNDDADVVSSLKSVSEAGDGRRQGLSSLPGLALMEAESRGFKERTAARQAGDPAHARAVKDQRVDHIVRLMAHGEWHGAGSHHELSDAWGVSIAAVQEYARIASGIIRVVVEGNPDEVRAEIIAGIEAIKAQAIKQRELRTALQAVDLKARMLGLITNKVEARVEAAQKLSDAALEDAILAEAEAIKQRKALP